MAFSYNNNPGESTSDYIRFIIGDTNASDPMLQDEEIQFCISSTTSKLAAAIMACAAIKSKLAYEVDYSLGPESVSASQRFKQVDTLLTQLKKELAYSSVNALPSIAPVHSSFDIGMHDNRHG